MVIGNGFFSDTIEDALEEMTARAGCEVRRCVFPTAGNLTYYVSERGDLFGVQRMKGTGKLITRGPKQPATKHSHGRRHDGGLTHRLSTGSGHGAGGEQWVAAELLVYCSFTLGRWEPSLRIDFKNGKATDLRPDNLEEHREEVPPEWRERLATHTDIYSQDFDRVAESVKWWCGISKEDAKDVAQSTFVWLCTSGYKDAMNTALWTWWSRRRGLDFFYHHQRHFNNGDFDDLLTLRGQTDPPCEIDLFHLQPGEKRARYLSLWAQGLTPTEIGEMTGSTCGNVGSSVTRSIQFLQRYFRHEKDLLR